MLTKPMKTLVALAGIALLGSLVNAGSAPALANGVCGLTPVDANSLGTAGESSNPWKVTSAADFALVGAGDCSLNGHYLQTASFSVDTSTDAVPVDGIFAGVYNGDHWQLTLAGGSDRAPFDIVTGTIKKLRLTGEITSVGVELSSLARHLNGGVISEVGSLALILSNGANSQSIGGLVAKVTGSGSLIQYSYYSGRISRDRKPETSARIGGLVGFVDDPLLVRDSYARATINVHTGGGAVRAGGIIGETSDAGPAALVRTYAAGSFTDSCSEGEESCLFLSGGLLGGGATVATYVSSFWLSSSASVATSQSEKPVAYSVDGLPVAVGVNAQTLRDLSTFQTKEGTVSATPGGNDMPLPGSTRLGDGSSPLDIDYRWAIEFADISPFVAQKRQKDAVPGETVTYDAAFDRVAWENSPVPLATYSTRATTSSSDSYPAIGRVWEICSNLDVNDGFPVLVWEGYNCPGEGTGGGVTDSGTSQAHASGLSGAELTAFLASGLTLEQWLAQRLAATGAPGEPLGLGGMVAGVLTMVGLGLLAARRRLSAPVVR